VGRPGMGIRTKGTIVTTSSPISVIHGLFSSKFSTASSSLNGKGDTTSRRTNTINVDDEITSDIPPNPQSFVKERLDPGEWNPFGKRTDPIFRPPWKSRAQIMNSEDFANRPRVTFEEEFSSLHDGMVVLSWLTQGQRDEIYSDYLAMTERMSSDEDTDGVTSHEYVVRVVGQKHGITAMRVAAIVQLAHNEERIVAEGQHELYNDVQEYVDASIRKHIQTAYREHRERDPDGFVEDPVGVIGEMSPEVRTAETIRVEDLHDVDDLERRAAIRGRDEARLHIDRHVYIEDVDDSARDVSVNRECIELVRRKTSVSRQQSRKDSNNHSNDKTSVDDDANTDNNNKKDATDRRPRWKYVAKVINTRDEKKTIAKDGRGGKGKKARQKRALSGIENTIVENDGVLRVATVQEAKKTAWKPERENLEFAFKGVKNAWLERKLRGEVGGWGLAPKKSKESEVEA